MSKESITIIVILFLSSCIHHVGKEETWQNVSKMDRVVWEKLASGEFHVQVENIGGDVEREKRNIEIVQTRVEVQTRDMYLSHPRNEEEFKKICPNVLNLFSLENLREMRNGGCFPLIYKIFIAEDGSVKEVRMTIPEEGRILYTDKVICAIDSVIRSMKFMSLDNWGIQEFWSFSSIRNQEVDKYIKDVERNLMGR